MGKKSIITQNKIAETARELFLEKGFDGVKMQELRWPGRPDEPNERRRTCSAYTGSKTKERG